VVRRFGRILETAVEPGLYIGLPWGMDRLDRVPIGLIRKTTVGHITKESEDPNVTPVGQLLTGDHNLVNVQIEVYYTVNKDAVARYVLQADSIDALVARVAETRLAEWVAGRAVDDILLRGKTALPNWLVGELRTSLASYELGINVDNATVTHLLPPTEVKKYFDDVARVQTEIRTAKNRAEQDADSQYRDTAARVFETQRRTAAYANEQRLAAQAEAMNFDKRRQQYQRLQRDNPHYLAGIWWAEMSQLYAKMRANGRIDLLDHYLDGDGLNITQMPLLPKKK
jgi:membrane protease subunit HflK